MSKKQDWLESLTRGASEGFSKGLFQGTSLTVGKEGLTVSKDRPVSWLLKLAFLVTVVFGMYILYKGAL